MQTDRAEAITTLLLRAEEAHATYEATELNGVYDMEWPRWYAAYAVEHDLSELLGHAVPVDDVAEFLANTFAEFERVDLQPGEPWATSIADRMAVEL